MDVDVMPAVVGLDATNRSSHTPIVMPGTFTLNQTMLGYCISYCIPFQANTLGFYCCLYDLVLVYISGLVYPHAGNWQVLKGQPESLSDTRPV